jgi:tRNA-dihydrouridine synthase A
LLFAVSIPSFMNRSLV